MRLAWLVGVASIAAAGCGTTFESGAGASTTGATTTASTSTSGGAGGGSVSSTSSGVGGGSVTTPTGTGGAPTTSTGDGGGGASTASSPCDGVPGGEEHEGRCYVVIGDDEGMDFATARAACESFTSTSSGRVGHLVHVDGPDEEAWIELLTAPWADSDVLIGLRCPDGTSVATCVMPGLGADPDNFVPNWRWIDDDAPCTYADWPPPGPMFVVSGADADLVEDGRCAAIQRDAAMPDPTWAVRPCSRPTWPPADQGQPARPMRALCEIE